MNIAHILLSGLLILASFWHWAYWDLDLFFTSTLTLDLNQILSIHLTLASSLCLAFFFGHLWHASRAIFQDIWTGVTFESQAKQEYGRNEKLGDKTSSTKTTL